MSIFRSKKIAGIRLRYLLGIIPLSKSHSVAEIGRSFLVDKLTLCLIHCALVTRGSCCSGGSSAGTAQKETEKAKLLRIVRYIRETTCIAHVYQEHNHQSIKLPHENIDKRSEITTDNLGTLGTH